MPNFRQTPKRGNALLAQVTNDTEQEYLDLLGVPFFVQQCMEETFPDLQERLMLEKDAINPYEEFLTDKVPIDVRHSFLKLARRCFRIDSRLKTKALNIETLLCRKYSNRSCKENL